MNRQQTVYVESEVAASEVWSPYHALLGSMLRNAVEDACFSPESGPMKSRLLSRAARKWFASNEVGAPETGITFLWVCEHLSISPDAVRMELKELLARGLNKPSRRRTVGIFT
jgi:hypothetical protein